MVNDSKQLRVDNWGVFFLQRLQLFFSKTDFCDLTLQFDGNMQLKVHRLVMNACTDYFIFLEQTCPAADENTIMMPPELQSDVIVPIVNFMYTGLLEYETKIYEKLYRATEIMNISVLTKLLDAQRQSIMKSTRKKTAEITASATWCTPTPVTVTTPPPKKPVVSKSIVHNELPATLSGRKMPIWKRQKLATGPVPHAVSGMSFTEPRWHNKDHSSGSDNIPKPTRFEWPEDDLPVINPLDTSFEEFSYTSKPLLTKDEEIKASTALSKPSSSKSLENNDMAELCIFGEGEDSNDFSKKRKILHHPSKVSPKRSKMSNKENKEATISLKVNSTDMDHTKIVTDILKKYPDLVKKNKNIRVKFVPGKAAEKKPNSGDGKVMRQESTPASKPRKKCSVTSNEEGPWTCKLCDKTGERTQEFVLYYLYRKHMTDVHNEVFDIRLCKYCGKSCPKHRLMMYHLFVRHGLKPPSSYDFPICDRCPYIGISVPKLLQHQKRHQPDDSQCQDCKLAFTSQLQLFNHMRATQHNNSNPTLTKYDCQYCTKRSPSTLSLLSHVKQVHLKEATRDGVIGLDEELEEYEEEEALQEDEREIQYENLPAATAKPGSIRNDVKIISNIKVPDSQPAISSQEVLQVDTTATADLNVPSGIATSLGLVDIVVMDEDQQYVLQQSSDGGQEFMIPTDFAARSGFSGQVITTQHGAPLQQSVLQTTGSDITSTDELVMVLTDHDYQEEHEGGSADNSNIVVLYSHPVGSQQGQFITSQGNLLVNAETGMLEIRNGSGIPTSTPNEIMVDTSNESPIESIEMIQREIQSHTNVKSEPFFEEQIKASNANQQTQISQHISAENDENLLTQTVVTVHQAEAMVHRMETTVYQSEAIVNRQEGNLDHSSHDEEDLTLNQSEVNIVHVTAEQYIHDENKSGDSSNQLETQQTASDIQEPEQESEFAVSQETDQSEEQDLSESANLIQVTQATEVRSETHECPKEYNEKLSEDAIDHSQEISMEIDVDLPQKSSISKEIVPTSQENLIALKPGKSVNAIQNSEDDSFEELQLSRDEKERMPTNIDEQSPVEVKELLPTEGVDVPPEISSYSQDSCEEEKDAHMESETIVGDNLNLDKMSSSEVNIETPCEAMEVDSNQEKRVLPASKKGIEGDDNETTDHSEAQHNDEEESNLQPLQDTKEIEYNRKTQSNINQTILDDWDDTDSQQSEKHHKCNERVEADNSPVPAEADEDVNKLMDDWEDEEDEEERNDSH